eukprot:TRINITY_DN72125_c0_g1_i1.p1 TRINITY_DN72125_c0_g1~~TRINITY_DN72125_c0_g1_i1.p1  ORF type:complete len:557 (+),score=87.35 TRINITY_DN72125_c0_g1_i1:77-1747(+)
MILVQCLPFAVVALALTVSCGAESKPAKQVGSGPESVITEFTATFKPGKLGIHADFTTGRVDGVEAAGQGRRAGVEAGMLFDRIDGKKYTEKLLDKRIAGTTDYTITFRKPPPAPPVPKKDQFAGTDVPPKPEFKFAEELTPASFREKIYDVTNATGSDSESAPYFPVVMFHVSWCKHCRHALPEFEEAAKSVEHRIQSGQVRHLRLEAHPKFFLIECNTDKEHEELCKAYTGTNYPVIKLFRNHRSMNFNRPRVAGTFAWWATYLSRAPIYGAATQEDLEAAQATAGGQLFILHAHNIKHTDAILQWKDVALDNLEDFVFALVHAETQITTKLPSAPGVTVWGKGLQPVEFQGEMTHGRLAAWVKFNQFEPVVRVSYDTAHSLANCGLPVVCLTFSSNSSSHSKVKPQFEANAEQLRKQQRVVFATADIGSSDVGNFLSRTFPLVGPGVSQPPHIFVFQGMDVYWESSALQDPKELSLAAIENLMADSHAMIQRGTAFGWLKEKGKLYLRYASHSIFSLLFALAVPLVALACLGFCAREILSSDTPDAPAKSKKE